VAEDGDAGEIEDTPEALAAKELEQVEAQKKENLAPKEGTEEGSKVFWKGEWVPKSNVNYRMHLKTQAEKQAKEEAATAKEEAKAERESKAALEARIKELTDKYEPPKPDIQDPEPLPTQFNDVNEYAKALKEWTADNTRREEAQKQVDARAQAEHEQTIKDWNKRQEDIKKTIPDYAEKTAASENIKVSDQMQAAILESEVGPQILYHLAENPDMADKLGQMSVPRMLREFGKLEASFSGKDVTPPKSASIAEISRAPAPITPLKNASNPVVRLSGSDDVPASMTYEDWKKQRMAGKIK
jgi:hypothetical protein